MSQPVLEEIPEPTQAASAEIKGRTNWEYAHALPPSVPWRGRFEDLTFRFDVEWYGRTESTGEALAAFADGAAEILAALGQRA